MSEIIQKDRIDIDAEDVVAKPQEPCKDGPAEEPPAIPWTEPVSLPCCPCVLVPPAVDDAWHCCCCCTSRT